MLNWIQFLLFAVLLSLVACTNEAGGPRLSLKDAWARPPAVEGGNGAIYFRLENDGNEADTLLSVESPVASAEIHQTVSRDDGILGMDPVDSVEIPAKGEVEFKPGDLHVMLIGVKQPLAVGDQPPLTLRFERAGELKLLSETTLHRSLMKYRPLLLFFGAT